MKIRVQHSRVPLQTIKAMGGVPTPMSLADVYPGLSEGIIDGLENPPAVLYGGKFFEVAKNLDLTAHSTHMSPFVAGTAFWDSLTPEQQKIITDTGNEMVAYGASQVQIAEKEALDNLKKAGVQINEVDIKAFSNAVGNTIQNAFPEWSPNLYKNIQAQLEQY